MSDDQPESRPYRNWRREQAEYLFHFRSLHRRNDLLQKRLDEAQAKIAKMQAERMPNPRNMAGHPVLGTVYPNIRGTRWSVRITIDGHRFVRNTFLTEIEARDWLAATSDAIGFDRSYTRMKEDKALMVMKMREIMADGKHSERVA